MLPYLVLTLLRDPGTMILKRDFFHFMYIIQHCFICRPSDSIVSEDAGIEPRTVATLALTARRYNPEKRD
jgi:hypothetical protein